MSGDHHPASLNEIEAWAEEALEERMDALRLVALIHWVHDLTGMKFRLQAPTQRDTNSEHAKGPDADLQTRQALR